MGGLGGLAERDIVTALGQRHHAFEIVLADHSAPGVQLRLLPFGDAPVLLGARDGTGRRTGGRADDGAAGRPFQRIPAEDERPEQPADRSRQSASGGAATRVFTGLAGAGRHHEHDSAKKYSTHRTSPRSRDWTMDNGCRA